jgi:hypothetical protein
MEVCVVTPRLRQVVFGLLVIALTPLRAQAQCFKFTGGCGLFPQQCFPGAAGPTFFFDGLTSQRRLAADSAGSTCHPPVTTGPPACCASAPPASSLPILSNLRAVLVASQGDTDTFEIAVDYDAPDIYCTNTGDWPPDYTCTNDPLASGDHLVLYLGSATSPIDVLSRGFIYFEKGTWTTNVPLACGESTQVAAQVAYLTTAGPLFGRSGWPVAWIDPLQLRSR